MREPMDGNRRPVHRGACEHDGHHGLGWASLLELRRMEAVIDAVLSGQPVDETDATAEFESLVEVVRLLASLRDETNGSHAR